MFTLWIAMEIKLFLDKRKQQQVDTFNEEMLATNARLLRRGGALK